VFFWPNFAIFDLVGKISSQKIKVWEFKKITVGSQSYLVRNQPQTIAAPHSMRSRRL
jgi:hypothetical protein